MMNLETLLNDELGGLLKFGIAYGITIFNKHMWVTDAKMAIWFGVNTEIFLSLLFTLNDLIRPRTTLEKKKEVRHHP